MLAERQSDDGPHLRTCCEGPVAAVAASPSRVTLACPMQCGPAQCRCAHREVL